MGCTRRRRDDHAPPGVRTVGIDQFLLVLIGMDVIVVGQLARDLVMRIDALPSHAGSAEVLERRELVGGKGGNQAIALHQLGLSVGLVGVAGADASGDGVLRQLTESGVVGSWVVRRGRTALLVDIVDAEGAPRLLEHVPPESLLSVADVRAAVPAIRRVRTLSLQAQQPPEALLTAARAAREEGVRVVLDGVPDEPWRDELLGVTTVLRADGREAGVLLGESVDDDGQALRGASTLLEAGPSVVALASPGGNAVAWREGAVMIHHGDERVVDPTGAGDSFTAGLIAALDRGWDVAAAAEFASGCAGSTVRRLGGRPNLVSLRTGLDR